MTFLVHGVSGEWGGFLHYLCQIAHLKKKALHNPICVTARAFFCPNETRFNDVKVNHSTWGQIMN